MVAEIGPLDILVNNAGEAGPGPFLQQSVTELNRMVAINLASPFALSAAVLPAMIEQPEEVAHAVSFFCSEHARSFDGQCLAVAGGEFM